MRAVSIVNACHVGSTCEAVLTEGSSSGAVRRGEFPMKTMKRGQ